MLSMSLAVVLFAMGAAAAGAITAPLAPAADAAPAAVRPLASGGLNSLTAAYSSRILHAIFLL